MDNKDLKNKRNKKNIIVLALMFLLLLCLFILQCHLDGIKQEALEKEKKTELENRKRHLLDSLKAIRIADSLAEIENQRMADSLKKLNDSLAIADSLVPIDNENKKVINQDSIKHIRDSIKQYRDSVQFLEKMRRDSLNRIEDSLKVLEKAKNDSLEQLRKLDSIRALDKTPPNAEITPPQGRYYDPVKMRVKCDEIKCKTFLSIGDTLNPIEANKSIDYNKTGSVFYYAEDSVGNKSPWEEAKYDMASDNICGKNAYPVLLNDKTICVDAYEYPNKPDENPRDMVSQSEATKLCEETGKHLCSLEEWQAACIGKDKTKYTYGNNYKQNKCNTNTKSVKRSGRKEQCRSWFGMYDMNGNLWEWTSTTNKEHPNMFYVAGGAWNTNNESKCSDKKFSFYPQNQYPNVGFRCCK